jgi:nicotinic acid mononucleotide adenylyltransferase
MKNVVLFGGSFNPPCIHHTQLVQAMAGDLFFDKIVIIPCGKRDDKNYVDNNFRMLMSEYAFADIHHVVLDFRNLEDETFISNYHLENLYKEYNVVLWHAIGSDLLVKGNDGFNPIQRKWTRGTFIWNNFNFLIIPRNGYPTIDALLPKQSIVVRSEFSGSSTDVRAAISKGELFRHLVDQETYNIIVKKNLYK